MIQRSFALGSTLADKDQVIEPRPAHSTGQAVSQTPAGLRAAAWLVGGALFVALVAQIGFSAWLGGKVYPGVTVAGVKLDGMTRSQARQALSVRLDGYKLKLLVGGKSYTATPQQAGINYDLDATVEQAYLQGRQSWYVPFGVWQTTHQRNLAFAFDVDQKQHQQYVQSIVQAIGQPPTDATIVIENGKPRVQADANGVGVSAAQVTAAISDQVAQAQDKPAVLDLRSQSARIKAADVTSALQHTNSLLAVPVQITYEGRSFSPTPAQIGEWITYDKSAPGDKAGLKPKISPDGIKHYLQSVAVKLNVNPVNREVNVENGVHTETKAGQNGLQLDQDTAANQIAQQLGGSEPKPVTVEAKMVSVPYQTLYNRTITLNYGRYIEVNLSRQHMWVYQDHQIIFDAPITSGATGAGFPTVQGLFSIQAKQTNRNLNGYAIGYNYNVFVQYWMPFYGNYGLHDASWRSSFGGSDYYYGGSHGCVNMPLSAAAFLYNWADVGTPVWVHS